MDETPYRLAYEASVRAIEDQARVLEDLRSRAATLVAAAALVTSFLGGSALTRSAAIEPRSWTGVALAAFLLTAVSSLAVLWPVRVRFSISAGEMLELVREREQASLPVTSTEALSELALRLELMYDRNAPRIRALLWVFESVSCRSRSPHGRWPCGGSDGEETGQRIAAARAAVARHLQAGHARRRLKG